MEEEADIEIGKENSQINIGVFDSGIGGLWILKYLKEKLPEYNYIYFGDQAHVPYGLRSQEEIKKFSGEITQFLLDKECQLIVVACNTASGASLKYLREKFPHVPFVGMEPAVKPAVEATHTGKVGVLATPATFEGELYNSVVERFAHDAELFESTCVGLVEQIEKGDLDTPKTKKILEDALAPMKEKNIDTVVLGCTHFPFVIPIVEKIMGENVKVIDPTPAIVRQVGRILDENDLVNEIADKGTTEIFTSGNPKEVEIIIQKLLGEKVKVQKHEIE